MHGHEADMNTPRKPDELPAWVAGLLEQDRRARRVARAVEALVNWKQQEANLLADARSQRGELAEGLSRLNKTIGQLVPAVELLESASKQQQALTEAHYERAVVEPMVAHLLAVVDLAREGRDQGGPDGDADAGPLREHLQAVSDGLEQFLGAYGVELFRTPAGTKPNRKTARPVQRHLTGAKERDGCVARTLRLGARRNQRVLRVEKVAVWRYQPPQEAKAGSTVDPEISRNNDGEENEHDDAEHLDAGN